MRTGYLLHELGRKRLRKEVTEANRKAGVQGGGWRVGGESFSAQEWGRPHRNKPMGRKLRETPEKGADSRQVVERREASKRTQGFKNRHPSSTPLASDPGR